MSDLFIIGSSGTKAYRTAMAALTAAAQAAFDWR